MSASTKEIQTIRKICGTIKARSRPEEPDGNGLLWDFTLLFLLRLVALAGVRAGGTLSVAVFLLVAHRIPNCEKQQDGDDGENDNVERLHEIPPLPPLKRRANFSFLTQLGYMMDDMAFQSFRFKEKSILVNEEQADVVDKKCRDPGESALIEDDAERAFRTVHFLPDRADGSDARCVKQGKNEERKRSQRGKHSGECGA